MNEIAEVLPESMKNALSEIPEQQWLEIEEVRIRINRPVELIRRGQPVYLSYAGTYRGCPSDPEPAQQL